MSEMMTFPDTWEEFEKLYGFNDVEEIYTNNSRLIPSFRVKQWVDHLLSEEPQKWIPCSERLPKMEVLCCDKYGEMIIAYVYEDNTSDTGFSAESETQCMYNCVAWQPLPEPWKGEE